MKKIIVFAAMLAIAASCTISEIESREDTTAPEITASFENSPKTTLATDEEGVGTIWWIPADEINIFYCSTATHYISQNTENATTVVFRTTDIIGSTESASDNIWGLYPYDTSATCDGSSVTTTIPADQNGVAGTFDDDLFTSLAHSEDNQMTFYNVCGGIKFSLTREDIKKITFKGNNNEDIAGKVSLSMDSSGKPIAEITAGEKAIILTPKTGDTFAKNTDYYVVMLPTVLSKGFTMTFDTDTQTGTFEYNAKSVEIKRSVFSKKAEIDTYATFEEKLPDEVVDLGLSVMWATCNLGATSPEEYGGYYQWAGLEDVTSTSIYLDWSNCPYHTGSSSRTGWTKYVPSGKSSYWSGAGSPDNKSILDPEDDVAYVTLGGDWRMPTDAEWTELRTNCTWTWTDDYKGTGIKGAIGTSKKSGYTDKSIFLPASGWREYDYLDRVGSGGYYWSSSLEGSFRDAYIAYFNTSRNVSKSTSLCYRGLSVRPVLVDMSTHSYIRINGQSPTTTSSGWKDYYQCTNPSCSLYFEDTNGAVLIGDETALAAWKAEGGRGYLAPVTVTKPELVDLGLSVKWATCNLGATKPEEYGGYYQWSGLGDVTNMGIYLDLSNCPYHSGSDSHTEWTKYIPSDKPSYWSGNGSPDNKTVLDPEDDVAYVTLGGDWRMPTDAEWTELRTNCTWTWTDDYNGTGIAGDILTSKMPGYTDKTIFLPAAGYRYSYSRVGRCSHGYYWSSSLTDFPYYACGVDFNSGGVHRSKQRYRYFGQSVRPVLGGHQTHTLIKINGQAPTTYSSGWKGYYQCTICGLCFEDAEGGTLIGDEAALAAWKSVDGRGYLAPITITTPEYVDLGLSVKWASWNLGATKPEEYGCYYQWGGLGDVTSTNIYLDWNNCPYHIGIDSSTGWTKYDVYSFGDQKRDLDPEDDVAHVTLGGNWRMPTEAEWTELRTNCTWTWTDDYKYWEAYRYIETGIAGQIVTSNKSGYTDKSIFLPAAGYRAYDHLNDNDICGYYWSSTLISSFSPFASCTYFGYYFTASMGVNDRFRGQSVRPVCD